MTKRKQDKSESAQPIRANKALKTNATSTTSKAAVTKSETKIYKPKPTDRTDEGTRDQTEDQDEDQDEDQTGGEVNVGGSTNTITTESGVQLSDDAWSLINRAATMEMGQGLEDLPQKVTELVEKEPTPVKKWSLLKKMLEGVAVASEGCAIIATTLWNLMGEDNLFEAAGFNNLLDARKRLDTDALRRLRKSYSDSKKRKLNAIATIKKAWGADAAKRISDFISAEHHLEQIARVAARESLHEALNTVLKIASGRVDKAIGGRAKTKEITHGDWRRYLEMSDSLLVLWKQKDNIDMEAAEESGFRLPGWYRELLKADDHRFLAEKLDTASQMEEESQVESALDSDSALESEKDSLFDFEELSESSRGIEAGTTEKGKQPEDVKKAGKTARILESNKCSCKSEMPVDMRRRLARRNRNAARLVTESARIEALRTIFGSKMNLSHVCNAHVVALATHLGFQLVKRTELETRVIAYWRASRDGEQSLVRFKTEEPTKGYFLPGTKTNPLAIDADQGIFAHAPSLPTTIFTVTDDLARLILRDAGCPSNAMDLYTESGNIVINNVFSYLWKGLKPASGSKEKVRGIGKIIDAEFRCYDYHQRRSRGHVHHSWLRAMVHSVTQQAIRVDPLHWALYVALRPDHNTRLVSFPYYAMASKTGDRGISRHIDLNIDKFIEVNRGGDVISGTVSLDDESEEKGCTEIVPGFHRMIEDWWRKANANKTRAKKAGRTRFIPNLNDLYGLEDEEDFGRFVRLNCQRGAVRISLPQIIYGYIAPVQKNTVRRTVAPWYVAVHANGSQLDNPDSGTWDQLKNANTLHEALETSPTGHTALYGSLPYKFPASVQLSGLTHLGRAILCLARWEDPLVQHEVRLVLGSDRVAAKQEIDRQRSAILTGVRASFKQHVEDEIKVFGEKSYYAGEGKEDARAGKTRQRSRLEKQATAKQAQETQDEANNTGNDQETA